MPSLAFDVSERELHNYDDGGDAATLKKIARQCVKFPIKIFTDIFLFFFAVAKIYLFISILRIFLLSKNLLRSG